MSISTKKRKADSTVEFITDPQSLQEAWAMMKQTGPRLFTSLSSYLGRTVDDNKDATEMMAAVYFKSAIMENKFVVPLEFRDFTIKRDKKGTVTQILDTTGHSLAGANLSRVMIYAAMREKGMASIIMIARDDSTVEVLAIPNGIQIDEVTLGKGAKDFHKDVRSLYTYKAGTTVYASAEHIVAILELSYVEISEVTSLLKALNALAAKEDLSELDVEELADFDTIVHHLQVQESKQSRKHFLQTLMAASIGRMDMIDRIEHFNKNPSYTLANNLELRLPHSGPCYTKLGNKHATKVSLSSLGPEDSVLLSTNFMSQRDYKNIMGNVADYEVYVDSDNLGGRKGPKFANMSVKFKEIGSHVTSYLTAIATANGKVKSDSSVLVADPAGSAVKEVELDFEA